jgi:hypothetical protein
MVHNRNLETRVGTRLQEEDVPYIGRRQILFTYFWSLLKYGD